MNNREQFYATDILTTGSEIFYLWVVRMIMLGVWYTGEVPFRDVFIHGMVRDEKGVKMSKSLGNGVDPIEMVEKYNADALRVALAASAAPGRDVKLSKTAMEERVKGYRNLTNKIWNVARWIEMGDGNAKDSLADDWVKKQAAEAIEKVSRALDTYHIHAAVEILYDFTWRNFADIYVEARKPAGGANAVSREVFEVLLKLWQPFAPFVTQAVYFEMLAREKMLIDESWPSKPSFDAGNAEKFEKIVEFAEKIRSARAEAGVDPTRRIKVFVVGENAEIFVENAEIIGALARVGEILNEKRDGGVKIAVAGAEATLENLHDAGAEAARRGKEVAALEKVIAMREVKLASGFAKNAPENVVKMERGKLAGEKERLEKLKK